MTTLDVAEELHAKYGGCMEKMLRDVMKVRDADVLARKAAELLDCEPASLASKKTPEQWEPVVKKLISWKMIDRNMMKQAKIDDCIKAEQMSDGRWAVTVDDGLMKELSSLYSEMMSETAGNAAGNVVSSFASAFEGFAASVKRELDRMPKRQDDLSKLKQRAQVLIDARAKLIRMKLGPNAKSLLDSLSPEIADLAEGVKKLDMLKIEDSLKKSQAEAESIKNDSSLTNEQKAERLKAATQSADSALSEYGELFKKMSEKLVEIEKKMKPLTDALEKRQ